MLSHLDKYQIILASQSPRRRQLLAEIIPNFSIQVKEVDEVYPEYLKREQICMHLSNLKSEAFGSLKENEMVITSDTIVCLEDEVLGKPKDEKDALSMLLKLAGKTHTVYTGVTIRTSLETKTFYDATKVTFYNLSEEELVYYIHKCKPFDKAGSYGIQEWLGYVGIEKMEGEFYNVMGLPVHKLYSVLKSWSIS
jgi:septum formation protein